MNIKSTAKKIQMKTQTHLDIESPNQSQKKKIKNHLVPLNQNSAKNAALNLYLETIRTIAIQMYVTTA